jgi:hypothetical protein
VLSIASIVSLGSVGSILSIGSFLSILSLFSTLCVAGRFAYDNRRLIRRLIRPEPMGEFG